MIEEKLQCKFAKCDWHTLFREPAIYAFLFLVAFLPRVISLGSMLTIDESLWLVRAPAFMNAVISGNLAGTFQSVHPGVTLMWLTGGMAELFWYDCISFNDKLAFASFPVAFVTAAGVPVAYFLLKKLFGDKIAIIGSLLVALDPFFIAHSRVLQLDALLTTFMWISVLATLVFTSNRDHKYLLLAGVLAGFALLTKFTGLFLVPFLASIGVIGEYYNICIRDRNGRRPYAIQLFISLSILAFVTVGTFVVLWPSMWVDPLVTLDRYVNGVEWAAMTPHENGGFFLGQITSDGYGPLFYPVTMIMRSSPLVLVFGIVALVYLIIKASERRLSAADTYAIAILGFIILFTLQMTIGSKKFDRYLLPVFPGLDILAAVGIIYFTDTARKWISTIGSKRALETVVGCREVYFAIVIACVLITGVSILLTVHPYYLAYYNPVVPGDPSIASGIMMVGWGEGLDQAAKYLNDKPGSENLTVAAQYAGFKEYFDGNTVDMGNASSSDYIVFYICAVQRNWHSDLWQTYSETQPVKIITINGIDYCWIYKTERIETLEDL